MYLLHVLYHDMATHYNLRNNLALSKLYGLYINQCCAAVTGPAAYSVSSSIMCKTSWNMERMRPKWEPSQNTLPHLVQTQKSDILGRRLGGTVWSCMAAPPGKFRVSGSNAERGAQRHWGAYLGSSAGMLEVRMPPSFSSSCGWDLCRVWSVLSWSCRNPTGKTQKK